MPGIVAYPATVGANKAVLLVAGDGADYEALCKQYLLDEAAPSQFEATETKAE